MAAILGTKFDDFLSGTSGPDLIQGGAGHDWLLGLDGNDTLDGGDGNDVIFGFAGDDVLLGGDGDDFLRGGSGNDLIDGGSGIDRVSYYPSSSEGTDQGAVGVTVSLLLQGVPQDTGQGWDTLVGIEYLSGTPYDDVLIGDDNANWIWTGTGPGNLTGNDTVYGYGGDDRITVGIGNHTLDGGSGVDVLDFHDINGEGPAQGVSVSLLLQGTAQDTGQGMMTLAAFENLSGTGFDDWLIGDGGDNVLAGYVGNDHLIGGAGNDTLWGDGLFDILVGPNGNAGPIVSIPDVSKVRHTSDKLTFVGGNDVLDGGQGDDVLVGGGGDDLVIGGDGDDVLDGSRGHDLLIGGSGNDTLSGGANWDSFEFGPGGGCDTILDFDPSDELIILKDLPGIDDFSDLVLTKSSLGTVVSWGDLSASITLLGVRPNELSAGDFSFGDSVFENDNALGVHGAMHLAGIDTFV